MSLEAKRGIVCLQYLTASFFMWQLLDWLLGEGHSALLRRAELKTFVDMHGNKVSV